MNHKAYIVTDLGYGDCGKGTTVDWLCRQAPSVVIRHNGGPQAGHNVVDGDKHHEFSQYGAGTFAGAKTYLSKHMLIHPQDMMEEWAHLKKFGDFPKVRVDNEARIITPYHVALNRALEVARGDQPHGSCGRGVGTLMEQDIEHPQYTIRVEDLPNAELVKDKLYAIRKYLVSLLPEGDWPIGHSIYQYIDLLSKTSLIIAKKNGLPSFYKKWYEESVLPSNIEWLYEKGKSYQMVFEGAQGVLLDEWYGFHPYTTWSTTTHENALDILDYLPQREVHRLGVIRAYTTRHGPGPFPTENPDMDPLKGTWKEPHNPEGPWQKKFRVGSLDLALHRYAMQVCGGVDGLVVTHLDRCKHWKWSTSYGNLLPLAVKPLKQKEDLSWQHSLTQLLLTAKVDHYAQGMESQLLHAISSMLGAKVWLKSYGPTAKDKLVPLSKVPFSAKKGWNVPGESVVQFGEFQIGTTKSIPKGHVSIGPPPKNLGDGWKELGTLTEEISKKKQEPEEKMMDEYLAKKEVFYNITASAASTPGSSYAISYGGNTFHYAYDHSPIPNPVPVDKPTVSDKLHATLTADMNNKPYEFKFTYVAEDLFAAPQPKYEPPPKKKIPPKSPFDS